MVCQDVKTISSAPVTVDEWNAELGAWAPAQVEAFDALMHKPVGVLLQREERVWEGRTHVGMKMVDFFDPRDRSTPSEILAGTRSGQGLARLVDNLREKVVRLGWMFRPGARRRKRRKGRGSMGSMRMMCRFEVHPVVGGRRAGDGGKHIEGLTPALPFVGEGARRGGFEGPGQG